VQVVGSIHVSRADGVDFTQVKAARKTDGEPGRLDFVGRTQRERQRANGALNRVPTLRTVHSARKLIARCRLIPHRLATKGRIKTEPDTERNIGVEVRRDAEHGRVNQVGY
ncbi:MAG: hypothetical protein ACK559_09820, partial [bacterium]